MNRIYFILFLFFGLVTALYSQTGTIKVAKPIPKQVPVTKKDSILKPKVLTILAEAGANYSFKGNNKTGYYVGIACAPEIYSYRSVHRLFIGVQYVLENKYYDLSAFNSKTNQIDINYNKSENKSEYLKLPIHAVLSIVTGHSDFLISLGLSPEYLLNNRNEYDRLRNQDFNRYNLAGEASFGLRIINNFYLSLAYSTDFFENLKDRKLYDATDIIIGTQKSKTQLLSFSVIYKIQSYLN